MEKVYSKNFFLVKLHPAISNIKHPTLSFWPGKTPLQLSVKYKRDF